MIVLEPLLIAWFIVYFEPLQNLIVNVKFLNKLDCLKCVSFWTTLIYGLFNSEFLIYGAIINSIIGFVFDKLINLIPVKL